jgi:hypothetical protein
MIKAFVCHDGQLLSLTDTSSIEALGQAFWIDLQDATQDETDRVQRATSRPATAHFTSVCH